MTSPDETIKTFRSTTSNAPSEALQRVYARIENGIRWLVDHDPGGVFHLWWTAKITRYPMEREKANPELLARRQAFAEYANGRDTFEALWRQMERLEEKENAQ